MPARTFMVAALIASLPLAAAAGVVGAGHAEARRGARQALERLLDGVTEHFGIRHAMLLMLELRGKVEAHPGGAFSRKTRGL